MAATVPERIISVHARAVVPTGRDAGSRSRVATAKGGATGASQSRSHRDRTEGRRPRAGSGWCQSDHASPRADCAARWIAPGPGAPIWIAASLTDTRRGFDGLAALVQQQLLYPIMFFDALRVKVRDEVNVKSEAVYVALALDTDGQKHALGLWIEQTEGDRLWLKVTNELKTRGPNDILIAVVDGVKGLPGAIGAVYPKSMVQTCIVHLIRNSLAFVSYQAAEKSSVRSDLPRSRMGCQQFSVNFTAFPPPRSP